MCVVAEDGRNRLSLAVGIGSTGRSVCMMVNVPVGPQRSFLRCIMYGAYRHLVPAGIKYGVPPVRDGQITSTVGVL